MGKTLIYNFKTKDLQLLITYYTHHQEHHSSHKQTHNNTNPSPFTHTDQNHKPTYTYKVQNIDTKQSNKRNNQNSKFKRKDNYMKYGDTNDRTT